MIHARHKQKTEWTIHPVLQGLIGILLGLSLVVGIFLTALWFNIQRFPLDVSQGVSSDSEYNAENDVWLIVGTDDRSQADDSIEELGPDSDNPGRRADIMFLARPHADGVTVLAMQRDILVPFKEQSARLNFMLIPSEQRLADAYCQAFHIPLDHMVVVDIDSFIEIVDAVGGIEVEATEHIRDRNTQLELRPGVNHLDGRQALGYVRSRHSERQVNGEWVMIDEFAGGLERQAAASHVMTQVMQKMKETKNPVTLGKFAWILSKNISVDESTSMFDFLSLVKSPIEMDSVDVESTGQGLATRITVPGIDQLGNAGMVGICEVEVDDSDFPEL